MKKLGCEYLVQTVKGDYHVVKWLQSESKECAFYSDTTTTKDEGVTVDQCGYVFDNESIEGYVALDLMDWQNMTN